jgi:glycosyltransferase involved in cell wall biosynthesis
MSVLFISNLYPSSVEPGAASYNRQLIAALAGRTAVRVIAPVFWFPGQRLLRGRRMPPRRETLDGMDVTHPRVLYTPGMAIHHHWRLYRLSIARHLRRVLNEFRPDRVMAGFLYPDAAAVLPLCERWGVPCAVRVNGSDFRLRMQQPRFRELVLDTLRRADRVYCPGHALRRDILAEGIAPEQVVAFDNGVDHARFRPRSREEALDSLQNQLAHWPSSSYALARLREGARCVLYVGHLRHVKGPDRLVAAWARIGGGEAASQLPGIRLPATERRNYTERRNCRDKASGDRAPELQGSVSPVAPALCRRSHGKRKASPLLVIAGNGNLRSKLERAVARLGLAADVCFIGDRPHDEIALWMNVADCLCLPSRSEGMPNVVVEALASGLPVVATHVGEVPYLVKPDNGVVCDQGQGESAVEASLAHGIEHVLARPWDRPAIARAVASMTWERAAEVIA